jgi:Cytoskeletal-regulatory complex EF hand
MFELCRVNWVESYHVMTLSFSFFNLFYPLSSSPYLPILLYCTHHFFLPSSLTAEDDDANPWGDEEDTQGVWALQGHVSLYKAQFDQISRDGLVSGAGAKSLLTATGLPTNKLRKIWELSDIDKDGHLDLQEFVIAMYLTEVSKSGDDLPARLDPEMIPKSKIRN